MHARAPQVRATTLPGHVGVGPTLTVTGVDDGMVTHLDGRPAVHVVSAAFKTAAAAMGEHGGGSIEADASVLKLGVAMPGTASGDIALRRCGQLGPGARSPALVPLSSLTPHGPKVVVLCQQDALLMFCTVVVRRWALVPGRSTTRSGSEAKTLVLMVAAPEAVPVGSTLQLHRQRCV